MSGFLEKKKKNLSSAPNARALTGISLGKSKFTLKFVVVLFGFGIPIRILTDFFSIPMLLATLYMIGILGLLMDGFTTKIGIENGLEEAMLLRLPFQKWGVNKTLVVTRALGIVFLTYNLFSLKNELFAVLVFLFIVVPFWNIFQLFSLPSTYSDNP